ncbi:hypothetical protein [Luteimonas sp. TWI1416]|uniref:hypothetical protein n=1 Tax=unclassified Luteimonas TaxID=2629088 RepID=UPI0032085C6A
MRSFVEQAVRAQVWLRQQQKAFIAPGIGSRNRSLSGRYVSAQDVVGGLRTRLDEARKG